MAKPNIEEVFTAFQKLQNRMVIATNRLFNKPIIYAAEVKDAQDEFKATMESFGLAEHIDWTNPII